MDFFNLIQFMKHLALTQSITRNVLAGFGMAWDIFILIILLGTVKGFQQCVLQLFNIYDKKVSGFMVDRFLKSIRTN